MQRTIRQSARAPFCAGTIRKTRATRTQAHAGQQVTKTIGRVALAAAAVAAAPHPAAAAAAAAPVPLALVSDAAVAQLSSSQVQQDPLAYSKETQLCITPFGVDIAGISLFVALVGAAASGITARKRKAEAERLNEQLRRINQQLRQSARSGSIYAPGLQYAPPSDTSGSSSALGNGNGSALSNSNGNGSSNGSSPSNGSSNGSLPAMAAIKLPEPVVSSGSPAAAAAATPIVTTMTLMSMDEDEMTAEQLECKRALRTGKALLKEADGGAALPLFERALVLSQAIGDLCQERRATRGLAAAAKLRGQHAAAIAHLNRVLEISSRMMEFTGDADAYGSIADCYTEMGDWEAAAAYYDKYIQRMESSVV